MKTVTEFDEGKKSLLPKADMNVARYSHSLVTISENVFCAIGGCSNRAYLKRLRAI